MSRRILCRNSSRLLAPLFAISLLLSIGCLTVGCRSDHQTGSKSAELDEAQRGSQPTPQAEDTTIVRLDPPKLNEPKADAADGVLLRLKLEPGASSSRLISGNSTVSIAGEKPVVQRFSMRVTSTVKSLDGDIYTLEVVATPLTVQRDDSSEQSGLFTEKPTIVDVDSRGRILTPQDAVVASVQLIGFIPFPEKRVAPGTSWSMSGEREWPLLGKVRATDTWTFRGTEVLHGKPIYKIEQSTTSNLEGVRATAVYYLDTAFCNLIAATVRQEGVVRIPAQNGKDRIAHLNLKLDISTERTDGGERR